MDNVQVILSPELYMLQLKNSQDEIQRLRESLKQAHEELELAQSLPAVRAVDKTDVIAFDNTYSDFKSDGVRKPHKADSIRSYDDFKAIQDYFYNKNDIRDWALWTIGVSMGLRISDLLLLRFGNLIDKDRKTIFPRIKIFEKKTGKINNLLITESVKLAILTYLESIKFHFDLDDYLFSSRKTGGKMYEEHGWRILSSAGKALGLPIHVGSHTMRKSFANIAACVDTSSIDMNTIVKVQGLLNHSDQKVTMRYLGTYQDMYDRARIAVSDFVLGKTGVNELISGSAHTVEDVIDRLDELENMISNRGVADETGLPTGNN